MMRVESGQSGVMVLIMVHITERRFLRREERRSSATFTEVDIGFLGDVFVSEAVSADSTTRGTPNFHGVGDPMSTG